MSVSYPEFSSLELLDQYIRNYETENCVQLWKRDSRTIEKMKAVCPLKLKTYNPELKYYSIIYACKKGGRLFKSESSGLRKTSSYKDNCPMAIKLALNSNGTKLKIVHMTENHNHPLDRQLFKNMPKQRKLEMEDKVEAIKMLKENCNQKLVQAYLQEKTGKSVKLKDLKNLRSSSKRSHKKRILNAEQKYKVALFKCKKIASIISNFSMNDFESHCNQLDDIIDLWSQQTEEVIVEHLEIDQEESMIP
ncbi:uncharacterized protein LOC123873373 [Maniola jurtina]|uniref:uncharacterized protein LOC123873373 n=1 Tax=Maniola jurtina TaxID=191418 RepID=UPI001E68A59D|nr:uncharacterized protein LOC123873373 [Maniola jurtina]